MMMLGGCFCATALVVVAVLVYRTIDDGCTEHVRSSGKGEMMMGFKESIASKPRWIGVALVSLALALGMLPSIAFASSGYNPAIVHLPSSKVIDMYRLYNPYSGEHFYTASVSEKDDLVSVGWKYEGVGWTAPSTSSTPVYRLYNPYVSGGDHHYTTSAEERNKLVILGWKNEGIGWYSDDAKGVPLYRQYNPYAQVGTHNYTTSKPENEKLVRYGWREEGVGWYGVVKVYS